MRFSVIPAQAGIKNRYRRGSLRASRLSIPACAGMTMEAR